MSVVHTQVVTRTHSLLFMGESLRGALRDVIRELGLDPTSLVQEWESWIGRGIKIWLESGHLIDVKVEFFKPGGTAIVTRWDFSVEYMSLGSDNDMWIDRAYLRQLIAKCPRPSADCTYRMLLGFKDGAPPVDGITSVALKSTGSLVARPAGTVIATGHVVATAKYWGP